MTDRRDLSTEEKRALVEKLLREKAIARRMDHAISVAERPQDIPQSFAQRRLWFLDQLDPGQPTYNLALAVRIIGSLDVQLLQRCADRIVERHETLRTTFTAGPGGEPIQVISTRGKASISIEQMEGASESEIRSRVETLTAVPFDLARGPLMRLHILEVDQDVCVMLLLMHHIVSDGWSMGVLFRELARFYNATLHGRSSDLPPLKLHYADYAMWQHKRLSGSIRSKLTSYWEQQLEGAPPLLTLPTDFLRPARQTSAGKILRRRLSPETTADVKGVANRRGVTLFMLLISAFQIVLSRWSGQTDIVIGTPVAGRTREELSDLIGFFINTLAIRGNLAGNPTFSEFLDQVRQTTLEAYDHQELPFEMLVEHLNPERDPAYSPVFQVVFNLHNEPLEPLALEGTRAEVFPLDREAAKFDLNVHVTDDDGLLVAFLYNADLFRAETVDRLAEQFELLLGEIARNTTVPIEQYSLLCSQSGSVIPDPAVSLQASSQKTAIDQLAEVVAENPSAIAIEYKGSQVSYADLWNSALKIGATLRERGMRPGDVVAVTGERSSGLIAAIIGVMGSGGVLLTIDKDLPARRIDTMLGAPNATFLVSVGEGYGSETVGADRQLETVKVDSLIEEKPVSESEPSIEQQARPNGSDPAYIFFTSGSSGEPKGVLGTHSGLGHFFSWQKNEFDIQATDRVALLTNLSFDVVLRDIFLPLTSGATLCVPSHEDISDVLQWINRERVTVFHAVPSVVRSWLRTLSSAPALSDVRWVFFAGEPLTDDLVFEWRERFPSARNVVNLYGPTETTLCKLAYRVPDEPGPGVQPIGTAMDGAQALIVRSDRLCAIGESGEIVIRTPYRTKGYVGAETPEFHRFRPNPFGDDKDDIVYFTGDRGRYRSDGTIEILGRLDREVKVRGIRINPEEVNSVLGNAPGVRQSAVKAFADEAGQPYLAAYFVPGRDAPAADDLRDYVAERLPLAMVPRLFLSREDLPTLPNGKIDYSALPAPDIAAEGKSKFEAPSTETEKHLAEIWSEVLGVPKVGVSDNFFSLGGHSLLATQIVARVRKMLKVQVPLQAIFQHPTVRELALNVDEVREVGISEPISKRRRKSKADTLKDLSKLSDSEVQALLAKMSDKAKEP